MKVVGVSFDNNNQIYYFDSNNLDLKRNLTVVVETERGIQFGKIELPLFEISEDKIKNSLKKVIRIATKQDYMNYQKNIKDAKIALEKCIKLTQNYKINMQIMDASYTLDRSQLLFRFISDDRIDFRKLAKKLGTIYKTRIELRQIGVRDKAKEIGGCGLCGMELCCTKFGSDFTSVSINMAKNQNISLNPSKINGLCGRLLCCLRYEDENYKECRKKLPKVGQTVNVENKTGKVTSIDIINGKYTVNVNNLENIVVDVNGNN